jgi:arginase family enzyme
MALEQMEIAYDTLLQHPTVHTEVFGVRDALESRAHPFILTLGGDHTIVRSWLYIVKHFVD